MKTALVTLSGEGLALLGRLREKMPEAELFVHESVARRLPEAAPFASIVALTGEIFPRYRGLVYAAPCGVVVRAIAPLVRHKLSDPAVVVTDVLGRWAVSLLSGHEGGANELALRVASLIGAEPVITTTSEAARRIIVGVGCRRGASAEAIAHAVREGLRLAGAALEDVRLLASASLKAGEAGLLEAARRLGLPLRFIAAEEIRASALPFQHSEFVSAKVGLPAVAEPSALLAGRRTQLILPKTIIQGVTVAVARENSLSSD